MAQSSHPKLLDINITHELSLSKKNLQLVAKVSLEMNFQCCLTNLCIMVPELTVSQNTAMSLSFYTLKLLLVTNVVSIWHMEVMFVLYLCRHCKFQIWFSM